MDIIPDITQGMHELKFGSVAHFPEEIIQEILIRLPIKPLIKCTTVCKTWRSMIISKRFMHTHLSQAVGCANKNDLHLLLFHTVSGKRSYNFFTNKWRFNMPIDEVHSLHYDNQTFDEYTKIEVPKAAQEKKHNAHLRVVGICNGLICLADDVFTYGYNFFIWNPAIRKLVTLPEPTVRFSTHGGYDAFLGFCFDPNTNDYKVVRIVTLLDQPRCPTLAEVYSLAQGSWSSLGSVSPECLIEGAASNTFVNGALHWPVLHRTKDPCYFILKFDVGCGVFSKMFMPKTFIWELTVALRLSASGDGKSIALFRTDKMQGHEDSFLDIWVMKEYGKKQSWTNMITLGPQGPEKLLPVAICFRNSGEIVLKLNGEAGQKLVSFDLVSKKIKDLGISGSPYCYCSVDFYNESLMLLEKSDAESY